MEIDTKQCSARELYKLLTGSVVPRPIALVSTKDSQGVYNVAPYSFFNVVTNSPPIVYFSIGERKINKKDTLDNIEMNRQFVINITHQEMAKEVNNAAALYKKDISEFDEVGFTPVKTKKIDSVAVKESLIHLECELEEIIKVGRGFMVLGRVVHFYVSDEIYLGNYKIDFEKLNPLARFAGNKYGEIDRYFTKKRVFDVDKTIKL